jgi:2-keto-4-pentenoate hydratase/2-oxohepta-3-ene-1,7-dioic acid hydratase in catechol pathway
MEGIVVANVFHRAVVFGAIHRGATPRGRDAALTINGTRHDADEEPIEIAETIRSVARVLAACGARLRPGDRIIGGSLAHVPVGPGDDVVAAIDGLGEVRARVA